MEWRSEDLEKGVVAATPTALGLVGVLALAAPLRLAEGAVPTPLIPLFVVYFWSLYAPSYLPGPCVFLIGLAQDLVLGGPIGLWAAVYLATHAAVMSQREFFLGRPLDVVWTGFFFSALFAGFGAWLIASIYNAAFLGVGSLVWQMSVTVLVYPLFAMLFGHLHRKAFFED